MSYYDELKLMSVNSAM